MSDDLIIHWYDEAVLDGAEDGSKLADTLDEVCKRVESDPEGAGVPPDSELRRAWVERTINGERRSRKAKRREWFRLVRDALSGETILGADDPILDLAMRVGTSDGLDKAFRYWSVQEWLDVLAVSAEKVRDAAAADEELRQIVNPIIIQYAIRGIRVLEDVVES